MMAYEQLGLTKNRKAESGRTECVRTLIETRYLTGHCL